MAEDEGQIEERTVGLQTAGKVSKLMQKALKRSASGGEVWRCGGS